MSQFIDEQAEHSSASDGEDQANVDEDADANGNLKGFVANDSEASESMSESGCESGCESSPRATCRRSSAQPPADDAASAGAASAASMDYAFPQGVTTLDGQTRITKENATQIQLPKLTAYLTAASRGPDSEPALFYRQMMDEEWDGRSHSYTLATKRFRRLRPDYIQAEQEREKRRKQRREEASAAMATCSTVGAALHGGGRPTLR